MSSKNEISDQTRLLLLDRDGTINKDDNGYSYRVESCVLFDDVLPFFRKLKSSITVVVVTNQSGVSRSYFTLEMMHKFNRKISGLILDAGSHLGISNFYYCPHHPNDLCDCRKPKPGLILSALRDYNVTPSQAILIGDKLSDCEAASAANIPSFLLDRSNPVGLSHSNDHDFTIINSLVDKRIEFLFT